MDAQHYLLEVRLLRDELPSFEEYPFCLPAVAHLRSIELHPAVTFIIGENGSGKSTLLEAIAVAWGLNPEGGSRNMTFSSRESHSQLHQYLRLVRGTHKARDGYFLRAESFFNVATEIEKLDTDEYELANPPAPITSLYGGKPLHEQSHGESFLALLMERFGGNGFYVLDEPEAALSPTRQMAAMSRIHQLVAQQSQFIIATHSPIIMAYPNATILHLSENGVKSVRYVDTEYYRLTKDFLNRHEQMMRVLMEE